MPTAPDEPDPIGTAKGKLLGFLQAALDSLHKEDDRIGGRAVTRLTADVTADDTSGLLVESTIGFGEQTDGTGNAKLLVGGEVMMAATRRSRFPFQFTTLSRAQSNTEAKAHPAGTLVIDLSRNTSGIDLLRRGFLVDFATNGDLDVIARNFGLHRCPGVTEEQLRRIIKAVAYLPKQPVDAFRQALEALLGNDDFTITVRTASDPWKVFISITTALSTDIRGRFLLNGGERQLTTGLTTVLTAYDIDHVIGVYLDTEITRRGWRDGFTNFFSGGGSFIGNTITLGSSPGAIGTAVIVDYGAFEAHYLALDETVRQDLDNADRWAYLADPLLAARCLLNQIAAAGIEVVLSVQL